MIQLILWLAVCAVLCAVFRKRLSVILAIIFCLRIAVPSVASGLLVGSYAGIHPATWLVVVLLGWVLVTNASILVREANASPAVLGLGLFLLAEALLVTQVLRHTGSMIAFFNTFVAAALYFYLVRALVRDDPRVIRVLMNTIVWAAVVQGGLAIAQFLTGNVLFYASQRTAFYWFDPSVFTRAVGTLDSPIDLGMLCAIAVPLCVGIKRASVKFGAAFLITAGAILSESRTGTIVAIGGIVYLLIRSRMSVGKRTVAVLVVGVIASAVLFTNNDLIAGLNERLADDQGSSDVRSSALDYILSILPTHDWYGGGYGSSYDLHLSGFTSGSLENGYLMYLYDFGFAFGLVFIVGTIFIPIVGALRKATMGTAVSAVAAIIMATAFSGLFTQSAACLMLFSALGLCLPFPGRQSEPNMDEIGSESRLVSDLRLSNV